MTVYVLFFTALFGAVTDGDGLTWQSGIPVQFPTKESCERVAKELTPVVKFMVIKSARDIKVHCEPKTLPKRQPPDAT